MNIDLIILIVFNVLCCHGATLREQLERIQSLRRENNLDDFPSRRFGVWLPGDDQAILGVPSRPSHLPEAEPILPGHTLIRPTLTMLKSAIKFPHRELENGAGVYGNLNSLSITWGPRQERVLYTGFRRMLDNNKDLFSPKKRKPVLIIILNIPIEESKNNEENNILEYVIPNKVQSKNQNLAGSNRNLFFNTRRAIDNLNIAMDTIEDSSSQHELAMKSYASNSDSNTKDSWYIRSQDLFDHIKLDQSAIDFKKLMPNPPKPKKTSEYMLYSMDHHSLDDDEGFAGF